MTVEMGIKEKLENVLLQLIYKTALEEFGPQDVIDMQKEFNRSGGKVLKFQFMGSRSKPSYFYVKKGRLIMIKQPKTYDVELSTSLKTLLNIGRGTIDIRYAIRKQLIKIEGERYLGDSLDFERMFERVFKRIQPSLLRKIPLKLGGVAKNDGPS